MGVQIGSKLVQIVVEFGLFGDPVIFTDCSVHVLSYHIDFPASVS